MRTPRHRTSAIPTTITIRCRLFGRYAEALGVESVDLELARNASTGDAVAALRSRLQNPDLLPERPLVAVNQQHALPDTQLEDGDELAILPPLAGGSVDHVTAEPIVVSELLRSVSAVERGGVVLFLGTVRRSPEDGPVGAIEYSAYMEMADAEFERIVREAQERWPEAGFAAQHRVGHVPVGEPSIAVAAAAPHRAEAFAACRYVIEEAKKRLPVWKKELLDDGRTQWREGSQRSAGPLRSPSSRHPSD